MEPFEALREAGRIASKVRDTTLAEIEPGMKVEYICDLVNQRVKDMGGKMAFPCNVDIDEVAAHYCAPINDKTVIPERSLVKLDVGVHVDGYIADTAKTVCFDPSFDYLVEAATAGLDAALQTIRPGVRANEIGAAIEDAIKRHGAKPIRNLTGHKLARYVVHAGKSIPNINGHDTGTLSTRVMFTPLNHSLFPQPLMVSSLTDLQATYTVCRSDAPSKALLKRCRNIFKPNTEPFLLPQDG